MIPTQYQELANIYKILSHPLRLHILALLSKKPLSVSELQSILHCRQSNISQHLLLLYRKKLVSRNRLGKNIIYALPPTIKNSVESYLQNAGGWLPQLN